MFLYLSENYDHQTKLKQLLQSNPNVRDKGVFLDNAIKLIKNELIERDRTEAVHLHPRTFKWNGPTSGIPFNECIKGKYQFDMTFSW